MEKVETRIGTLPSHIRDDGEAVTATDPPHQVEHCSAPTSQGKKISTVDIPLSTSILLLLKGNLLAIKNAPVSDDEHSLLSSVALAQRVRAMRG